MAYYAEARRFDDYGYTRAATIDNSDESRKLLNRVRDDIQESAHGKRPSEEIGRRAYKAYRAYLDAAKHNYPTHVIIPYFYTTVETKLARMMQKLFGGGPFLYYQPKGRTKSRQAELLTASFEYHWNERRPMLEVRDNLKTAIFFGSSYACTSWREEWRWVNQWVDVTTEEEFEVDPLTGETMSIPVTVQEERTELRKTIDNAWFDNIPFPDAFPDWKRPTVREGRYFARRLYVDRKYVQDQIRAKRWKRRVAQQLLDSSKPFVVAGDFDAGASVAASYRWAEEVGHTLSDGSDDDLDCGRLFEVIEHWSPAGVATVVNRSYVVAADDNPFSHGRYPILQYKNKSLPGEHFGLSDFEVVEKIYVHMQEMANANGTEALMSAFPPILARDGAVDITQLVYYPGAIWKFTADKDIQHFERPNSGIEASAQQLGQSKMVIDDTLGTSEAFRGMANPRATATATTQAMQSAGVRIEDDIANFEEQFSIELGDQYRSMIQQYQRKDITIRLSEDPQAEAITVTPGDIHDADTDTVPTAGSNNIKELELKRILDFWQICLQFQVPALDPYATAEVVAELTLPKYKNRIMRSREDAQQIMMQKQMVDQAAQQTESVDNTTQVPGGAAPVAERSYDKEDDGGTIAMSRELGDMARSDY